MKTDIFILKTAVIKKLDIKRQCTRRKASIKTGRTITRALDFG